MSRRGTTRTSGWRVRPGRRWWQEMSRRRVERFIWRICKRLLRLGQQRNRNRRLASPGNMRIATQIVASCSPVLDHGRVSQEKRGRGWRQKSHLVKREVRGDWTGYTSIRTPPTCGTGMIWQPHRLLYGCRKDQRRVSRAQVVKRVIESIRIVRSRRMLILQPLRLETG